MKLSVLLFSSVFSISMMFIGCSNQSQDSNATQSSKNITTPTSKDNSTKPAGINGCSFEELAYSKGYAEGTKSINRKGHEERNVELYILRGGCSGHANAYNMLKNRHPDQYPQPTDLIFGLCTNGTIDGFDQKMPQQFYKKECEDKPLVDKSEYK